MLVEYGMEIIEAGLLEEIVVEIIHRAKITGAEEMVEKMVLKAMEILQQNM